MVHGIGSVFLPHLDEGAIWMRASMPSNISLTEAEGLVDGVHDKGKHVLETSPVISREILRKFPEINTACRADRSARRRHRPDRVLQCGVFDGAQ